MRIIRTQFLESFIRFTSRKSISFTGIHRRTFRDDHDGRSMEITPRVTGVEDR